MKLKNFFIILSLLTLTACSVTHLEREEAEYIAPMMFSENTDNSLVEVTIIRDEGFFGCGVPARVYMNGQLLVSLRVGEMTNFYLPPGKHFLKVKMSSNTDFETIDIQKGDKPLIRVFPQYDIIRIRRVE